MRTNCKSMVVMLSLVFLTLWSSASAGLESGLLGRYFNNTAWTEPAVMTRTDDTVNFFWAGAPDTGVNTDNFTVRWTGYLEAPGTGTYTFYVLSDDGKKLTVNGTQIINNAAVGEHSGTISLTEGVKVPLILDFNEVTGNAYCYLSWEGPNVPYKQIIPVGNLTHDEVATVVNVTSPLADGGYRQTQVISVEVEFSEPITVTGTPTLLLDMTGTDRATTTWSVDGAVLTLNYTLVAADASPGLDYVTVNSLTAGAITATSSGVPVDRTLPFPGSPGSLRGNKNLVIDSVVPTVTAATGGVNSPMANGTYRVGDEIDIQVYFSEPVWVTGNPTLLLETGAVDTAAVYDSGSGTNVLVFLYTVQPGDFSTDLDYASTSAISPVVAIADIAGNNPAGAMLPAPNTAGSLRANKNLFINGVPIVTNVTSLADDGRYGIGKMIPIQVTFSDPVFVTGTPTLVLETGGTDVTVPFSGIGSGSDTLYFNYTVASGNTSTDLNYVAVTSLAHAGGSTIKDALDKDAVLTLPALAAANSLAGNKAFVVETVAPTVTTNVRQNPTAATTNAQEVTWRVTFLDNGASGGAGLGGVTGVGVEDFTIFHTVAGITGATVTQVEKQTDLIYDVTVNTGTGNGTLRLDVPPSATINDLAGNAYVANYTGGATFAIDKVAPVVTGVSSALANGSYKAGQNIDIVLTFSKAITLTPRTVGASIGLTLETGSVDQTAYYYSGGSNATTLTVRYTVQAGDASPDLDYLNINALQLEAGATLQDALGNDANLTLPVPGGTGSLGLNKAIVIDNVIPFITNVTSSSIDGTYSTGNITIQITFSEPVTVASSPTLLLALGAANRAIAATNNATASTTVNVVYTIAAGDNTPDLDYVAADALGAVGVIQDLAANPADRTLPEPGEPGSLGANKNLVVRTTPVIVRITSDVEDKRYGTGQTIPIKVVFSEAVNVGGTPQLSLATTTPATTLVNYSGTGSGTDTLLFNYTVAASNNSADLNATALGLNGGTIRDVDLNNASLTIPAAPNSLSGHKQIVADGLAPTVTTMARQNPTAQNTNANSVVWRVTFLDNGPGSTVQSPHGMLNVDTDDFTPTVTAGSITGAEVTDVTEVTPLIFDVTVNTGTGDGTLRLDVLSTATMTDTAGTPYTANYNASTVTYIINKTAPYITNVTSAKADTAGIKWRAGQTVDIVLTFSKSVTLAPATVGASLALALETGTVDQSAFYQTGSAGTTLTVRYTIQPGDATTDLEYLSANALTLLGGATLRDTTHGNDAVLTLPAPGGAGSLGTNKNLVIDTEAPTVINVTSTTGNGTYTTAAAINVSVQFSEIVYTTGTPVVLMESGLTDRNTTTIAGSGTDTISMTYTVVAGDFSPDLDYVAAVSLTAGTIRDGTNAESNDAVRTLPEPGAPGSLSANKAIVINTTPVVKLVTSDVANKRYGTGQVIPIKVVFSEAVNVTGTPQLSLATTTPATTLVNYSGTGSGTDTLLFNYTVAASNNSADLNATALGLNGGTITAVDNAAAATLTIPAAPNSLSGNKQIVADGLAPTVTTMARQNPTAQNTNADTVVWRVTFLDNGPASTVESPHGMLNVGVNDFTPTVSAGSITGATVTLVEEVTPLIFDVTVNTGSGDGTLRLDVLSTATMTDTAGTPYTANYNASTVTYIINKTAPVITNVTSARVDTAGVKYRAGQTVDIVLTFSKSVTLAPATVGASLALALETGTVDQSAFYQTGSAGTTLTVRYTIQPGDATTDLEYLSANALTLLGGATLRDTTHGNDAVLTLPAPGGAGSLGTNKNIVIDTQAPTVINVTSTQADGTYTTGDPIDVSIQFSEIVYTTGTPTVLMETGDTDRATTTISGSGTDTLHMIYTVVLNDYSTDLDYVAAASLTAGTIRDGTNAESNDAVRTLPVPGAPGSLSANKAIVVNTRPVIKVITSPLDNGTYSTGTTVPINVVFSEAVYITGTPPFVTMATNTTPAATVAYGSGSGTSTLTFNYVIGAGQNVLDLNTVAPVLNGGNVNDIGGNAAVLTLPVAASQLNNQKDITIDTTVPTVTGVTSSVTNGTFTVGQVIPITVNFTGGIPVAGGGFPIQSVFVDTTGGVPTLTVETGSVDRQAVYTSGSGSTALIFTYTVQTGDYSADLDYVSPLAINLNGGTIKDYVNNANLLLAAPGQANSLSANKNIVVSAQVPQVTSVTSTLANGSYKAGQTVMLLASFSKPVIVTGAPQLLLETGATDRLADYFTGSGSSTLRFRYVVQPGDTSSDLDYEDVDALLLNSGTIKDSLGNDAVLDLSLPGTEGSLGFNKDLKIDTTAPEIEAITRLTPPDAITSATSVTFEVTFNETVTGVATTDFDLVMTDITDASFVSVDGGGAIWTVVVNTGSGSGSLRLDANVTSGPSIDTAGNQRTGAFTGEVYTIDKTGPVPVSINRSVPPGATTGLTSVTYAVTFNESTVDATADDFNLVTTGVTGASITNVAGSAESWTVTVNTGTGNGSIRLDADGVTDGPAEDIYGNPRSGLFTGETYTIDKSPPHITAINRSVPPSPMTGAASVTYAVTFDEAVVNVAADDFDLETTGLVGASIGAIAGDSTSWTVVVNCGTGDGTLRLNADGVTDGPSEDLIGNQRTGAFPGQIYLVDQTQPEILSIVRAGASPANAATVTFIVEFSEPVSGVSADDFAIAASGISGAAITNVDGSDTTFAIDLSTGTGSGTLGLNAAATDGPSADPTGNLRTGALEGEVYEIDRTAPYVTAITRSVPVGPRTNATQVEFAVQFSEPVIGVVEGDFSVVAAGVTGAGIALINGSGIDWTVTVNTPAGEGTVRLDALAGPGPATDVLGNQRTGAFEGETYTFDRTAPQVTAINRSVPAQETTNASSVTFAVTFDEAVTDLDAADFQLDPTGGISGAAIDGVAGSGQDWTVDVNTGTGDGTLGLNAVTGGPGEDLAGNPLAVGFTGQTYTLDSTPPIVTVATLRTNDTTPALSGSVNDNDATISVSVDGQTHPADNNGDGSWTLADNVLTALLDGVYDVAVTATDVPGNDGVDTTDDELTIDTIAPSITDIQSSVPQAERGDTVQISATVTDVSLLGTPSATVNSHPATYLSNAGDVYTFSYTLLQADDLGAATVVVAATDGLNNAQESSTTVLEVIDITQPTLDAITPIGPNPTSETNVVFQFVFSEAVQGFDATDVQSVVTGTGLGAIVLNAPVQIDGSHYTLNVTGIDDEAEGTITLSLRVTQNIRDLANNALLLTGTSGEVTLSNELSVSAVQGGGYFYEGDNVALSVIRSGGTGPYTFTWKKNDQAISGAPNANAYAFTAAPNTDDLYTCTVVDLFDNATVTAAAASVRVRVPLDVAVPATVGAYLGGPATLEADVTGGFVPATFQWYKDADSDGQPDAGEEVSDGGAFAGATEDTLVIDPVDGEEGDYFVVVTDANPTTPPKSSPQASVVSDVITVISGAALTVLGPTPNFVQLYSDRPAFPMSVVATGGIAPLTFEWFHKLPDLSPVSLASHPGGTTVELSINPVDIPRGDGVIYCVVTDAVGNHPSANASVEVEDHLSFPAGGELSDATTPIQSTFTFTITVDGGLGEVEYAWSRDLGTKVFEPILGEYGPSLTLYELAEEDSGDYQVEVSDLSESIRSQAHLEVSGAGVPAAGLLGLAALSAAFALFGSATMKRGPQKEKKK